MPPRRSDPTADQELASASLDAIRAELEAAVDELIAGDSAAGLRRLEVALDLLLERFGVARP